MLPLPEQVKITQLAWHDLSIQLGSQVSRNSQQRQEILHYQTLHRGRTLLSGVEGEVRNGEVKHAWPAELHVLLFYNT